MGYGAVVADGYGAAYNPHNDNVVFVITSFRHCPDTDSDFFAYTLESSFLQMQELCFKAGRQHRLVANGAARTITPQSRENGEIANGDIISREISTVEPQANGSVTGGSKLNYSKQLSTSDYEISNEK